MIARLVGVAVGAWLMFAPAVLDYEGVAATNDRIIGPISGSIAFVALWAVLRPFRWLLIGCGAWLVLAPLVLTYDSGAAIVSSLAAGLVLAATAPFGSTDERFGGGWRTVWASPGGTRTA